MIKTKHRGNRVFTFKDHVDVAEALFSFNNPQILKKAFNLILSGKYFPLC